jgi:2'-5' RNA ligase
MPNWFCPALLVPFDAARKINEWAQAQEWPEGTKLKPALHYHSTLLYAPDASPRVRDQVMRNEFEAQAVGHWSHEAWASRVSAFDPGDPKRGTPIVIELHSFWLTHRWNIDNIKATAKVYGLDQPTYERFQPHITVAELPPGANIGHLMPPHVNFLFEPEPVELHAYYDALRGHG